MAVIYLKHPVHGSMVACSDLEAKYDKGNGWVEYDPESECRAVEEPKANALARQVFNVEIPEGTTEVEKVLVEQPPVVAPDWLAPQPQPEEPKRRGSRKAQ